MRKGWRVRRVVREGCVHQAVIAGYATTASCVPSAMSALVTAQPVSPVEGPTATQDSQYTMDCLFVISVTVVVKHHNNIWIFSGLMMSGYWTIMVLSTFSPYDI